MTLLFFRAFLMVSLVAANTRQIAAGHFPGAFVCGCLISAVWYSNVGRASHDQRLVALLIYSLGAGCGTVVGMWLGGAR